MYQLVSELESTGNEDVSEKEDQEDYEQLLKMMRGEKEILLP